MDPLSDVLSLLKPRSHSFIGYDVGGEFAVQFPRLEGIKCFAVVSGEGWLKVDGVSDPLHLRAGDGCLLARGRPFRFASDLTLPSGDLLGDFQGARGYRGIVTIRGGGTCLAVGVHFLLGNPDATPLIDWMPPVVHLRETGDTETLRWSLDRIMQELRNPQPGGALLAQSLAHLMLVQSLRLHLARAHHQEPSWFSALSDDRIGRAIRAIHEAPARPWSLADLAAQAGMSRSPFAERFKKTVGRGAMEYLTLWRMVLAADRLVTSNDSISTISSWLGYQSESAFGAAFKRVKGRSPRQYAQELRAAVR